MKKEKNYSEEVLIKTIDFLLQEDEEFSKLCDSDNRLINIIDVLLHWANVDICNGCKYFDKEECECLQSGKMIYDICRDNLIEQISNGTLKPNGKGGAR